MELMAAYADVESREDKTYGGLVSGLFPSLSNRQPVMWADGRNVHFADRAMKTTKGQHVMFDPSLFELVNGLSSNVVNNVRTVFWGSHSRLWKWDETNGVKDISRPTGYTGVDGDLWSFEQWGNFMVATNNVDVPQVWKASGTFTNLGGSPPAKVNILMEYSPFLVAFSGREVFWCHTDDIEEWTQTANNAARSLFIRGLTSEIKAALPLGDRPVFYSGNEMRSLDFIRAPLYFGSRPLLEGIGALGKFSVCAVDKRHYGIGPRGIWVTDGVTKEFISPPDVHEFVYQNINREHWQKSVAWHDVLQRVVVFFFPFGSAVQNNIGVAFNYSNNTWSVYDFGRTAALDQSVFEFSITADENGYVYQQSVTGAPPAGKNDGVVPILATAEIKLGFGEGNFGGLTFGGKQSVAG